MAAQLYECSSCRTVTWDLQVLLNHRCVSDASTFSMNEPSQNGPDELIPFPMPKDTQMHPVATPARRPSTPSSINSSDSEQSANANGTSSSSTYDSLVRWEEAHVKLLIACWKKFEHLFKGKKTKKEIFSLIAFEFNKSCKEKVTGDQCLRKWGKLVNQFKEVEDHNKTTGNDQKDLKYYNEMAECLQKDLTVNPSFTMESSAHFPLNITQQSSTDNDDNEDESGEEMAETCDVKKRRCRKRLRSRSSAAEMLEFLKTYSEKREKVEEEQLQVVKGMRDDKKQFFDKFLDYLDRK